MRLVMSGLDYNLASVSLREQLAFTRAKTAEMDKQLGAIAGVEGCVLLSTCNRTELYLSVSRDDICPDELLCRCVGVAYDAFSQAFVTRTDDDTARHLMEVACGLHSQIWGEDQILSQVKQALAIAHETGATDPVTETLFRIAVSAGKEVKSCVRLTKLPTSAAHGAIEALKDRIGDLSNKKAVVIGNGEMGKFAVGLLLGSGCGVTVTLRSYHRGDVTAPKGCNEAPYDDRYAAMAGADILISATTSPHYTVALDEFAAVDNPPQYLIDLAIPRDIQPQIGDLAGVTLLNMDDFGATRESVIDPASLEKVHGILDRHMRDFVHWIAYKDNMPAMEEVKSAIIDRIKNSYTTPEPDELIEFTVGRTVEILAGRLDAGLAAESLYECSRKIRSSTRPRRGKRS